MKRRRHNARRTDPGTSHNAGRANRGSHQRMMLEAFAGAGAAGFTDHEAAVRAELNAFHHVVDGRIRRRWFEFRFLGQPKARRRG